MMCYRDHKFIKNKFDDYSYVRSIRFFTQFFQCLL